MIDLNWDGSSPDRADPQSDRPPSTADWDQIVSEVIKHQSILRTQLLSFTIEDYTDTLYITIPDNIRIADYWIVKTEADGGEKDSLTLTKNGNVEFAKINLGVKDKAIVRASELVQNNFLAGDILTIFSYKDTNCACFLYILTAMES